MMRRLIALSVLALAGAAIVHPVPARAQQYQGCQATVSDVTVTAGQTISVTGSGADPGAAVNAVLTSTIGSGVADANGNFSFPATVPAELAPGTYTLTVSCGNGATSITIEVGTTDAGTVPAVGTTPAARTGSDSTFPLTRLGIAVIATGGLALAVARRRRWARTRNP